ncbi:thioesterase family protein [Pseudomonas synxantha]|uniref:Thioesterase family protein n=1 Tax=Pseudomonas synxantha TaxID=47883 RepID=A0ABS0UT43_9PSED|nr:acyl-CoA thioesterase domain-containing protein [Pseudomonas synxantha]MBI6567593.1 thioesterase family protein [Pseudomonas synxantha]MBI6582292.1 thioesterase family protein [Pseudomonas synxantha]MBI6645465.1 thioesterase family protein [Pseudomonas synxantha]
MNGHPQWDQRDLTELLSLEPVTASSWRSHVCDANIHGQVFVGQLLGQALWAAAQTCQGRCPTSLQVTFLNRAAPQQPVEFSVDTLRDGQRLSRRLMHGVQGDGLILSANAGFQVAQAEAPPRPARPRQMPPPESLPTLPQVCAHDLRQSRHLQLRCSKAPLLDIRPVPCSEDQASVNYWMRLVPPLAGEGVLHHAALAYMSCSWLPAELLSQSGTEVPDLHWQISTLNHSLWFHSQTLNTNDWLLFASEAVVDHGGRSLVRTHIYQSDGRLLASMAQDLLAVARTA